MFTILGSCVTRDLFNFDCNIKLNRYFARMSIQSVVGEKYIISKDKLITPSNYHKILIGNDLSSEFVNAKFEKDEFLIIDLIDERFKLIELDSKVIGTYSEEVMKSNLKTLIPEMKVIDNDLNNWEKCFEKLMEHLKRNKIIDRIILHKCYYKNSYYDEEGIIKEFSNRKKEIEDMNNKLQKMYYIVEKSIPNISIVSDFHNKYICNENHRWGSSPIHYEDKYYLDIIKQLSNISK